VKNPVEGKRLGILDHKKTWRYSLHAPSASCVEAFRRAFSGGFHIASARWDVSGSENKATAIYLSRAGVGKLVSILSSRAESEEESAVGSQVSFEAKQEPGGTTTCTLWLSSASKRIGFTSDARFFRPYMRAVERHLRALDPTLTVAKT
jgi:hypothetical protein